MTGDKVEVVGLERLKATMRGVASQLADMTSTNREVANLNRASSSSRAPRKSGRLAGSLRGVGTPDEANVESSLAYAGVIHYGWPGHNIRANPFAEKAVTDTEAQQVNVYERRLEALVLQVKGA